MRVSQYFHSRQRNKWAGDIVYASTTSRVNEKEYLRKQKKDLAVRAFKRFKAQDEEKHSKHEVGASERFP